METLAALEALEGRGGQGAGEVTAPPRARAHAGARGSPATPSRVVSRSYGTKFAAGLV